MSLSAEDLVLIHVRRGEVESKRRRVIEVPSAPVLSLDMV